MLVASDNRCNIHNNRGGKNSPQYFNIYLYRKIPRVRLHKYFTQSGSFRNTGIVVSYSYWCLKYST
jgi:hypothetical protein